MKIQAFHAIPAALALALGLAVPTAFAQSTNAAGAATPETAATPPTAGEGAVQNPPQDPERSGNTATTARNWSDLDSDGNGSLSASEAAALPSLSQVFDQADADGNGELTQDEYKAWLAAKDGKDAQDNPPKDDPQGG